MLSKSFIRSGVSNAFTVFGLNIINPSYLPYSDRSGRYNFRNFRSVKNIAVGSVALFRFADKVLGWGVVSEKALFLPFSDPEYGKYEGFIMFNPKTVKAFETPLPIKDLERITGMIFHFKDNYKTGRAYYKIPFQFKDEIQSHVTER